jgi:hypothetical protein
MAKLRQTPPATLTSGPLAAVEASSSPSNSEHNNRPPAELDPADTLWGGEVIHQYILEFTGRDHSLSATYYWISKKWVPATKIGGVLVGSKRAIRQHFADKIGLVS